MSSSNPSIYKEDTTTCKWCDNPIHGFKDKISKREHTMSKLCQECQDKTFKKKKDLFTTKLATTLLVQSKLLPPSVLGIKDLKSKI